MRVGPVNLLSYIMLGFQDRGQTREVGGLASKRIERQSQFTHNSFHNLRHLLNLLDIGEFSTVDGCEAAIRETRTCGRGETRLRGTPGIYDHC
jgi:hypothetical protein